MAGQRFQTHTVASEGVELDENYQKMVADIEEQTQRSGWLFGRGAFDKADLQYLRDFNNSLRYKEVEIEDKEKELWERERARLDAEAAAALPRRPSAGSAGGGGTGPSGSGGGPGGGALLNGPLGLASRPAPLLVQVKVKPGGSKQQHQARAASPGAAQGPESSKRLKTETGAAVAAPAGPSALPSARSEPLPSSARGTSSAPRGAGPHAGGGSHAERQPSAPAAAAAEGRAGGCLGGGGTAGPAKAGGGGPGAAAGATSGGGSGGGSGGAGGLATLLGGYGSDSGDESEEGQGEGGGASGAGVSVNGHRDGPQPAQGEAEGRVGEGGGGGASGARGADAEGGGPGAAGPGGRPGLPPPLGLLSPEELLSDPRVISEGLLATRPAPQQVGGGDAWDSGESEGSESD